MAKNKNKSLKKPTESKLKKHKSSYLFIGGVFLFSIFSFWVTDQDFFKGISDAILRTYASISSVIINIFGFDTKVVNENIIGQGFSLEIKKGCDAIAPMILYTLSILFFPTSFKTKPKAIGIGLLLMFILNIIRIVTLYAIREYFPSIFDIMHTDVWQIIFIAFTMFLWLRWLKQIMSEKTLSHVEG